MTLEERETYLKLSAFDLAGVLCIGEAADQGTEGQIGVLSVVKNRHDLWKQDYQKVCLDPGQFECFDKEGPKLEKIGKSLLREIIYPLSSIQSQIIWLAETVLTGETDSNVDAATFYRRFDIRSSWFAKMIMEGKFRYLKQINDHVFYAEVKYV